MLAGPADHGEEEDNQDDADVIALLGEEGQDTEEMPAGDMQQLGKAAMVCASRVHDQLNSSVACILALGHLCPRITTMYCTLLQGLLQQPQFYWTPASPSTESKGRGTALNARAVCCK